MSSEVDSFETSLAQPEPDSTVVCDESNDLAEGKQETLEKAASEPDADIQAVFIATDAESVAENVDNVCCETEHDVVVTAPELSIAVTTECGQQVQTDEAIDITCDSSMLKTSANDSDDINIEIANTPCTPSVASQEHNILPESTTKPRGGRSYQESRRSKKSGSSASLGSSEKSKLAAASTVAKSDSSQIGQVDSVNSIDLCPSQVEHRAKGDVREPVVKSAIRKDDDVQETNIDCRPACDGDPLASGKMVEKPDIQSWLECFLFLYITYFLMSNSVCAQY